MKRRNFRAGPLLLTALLVAGLFALSYRRFSPPAERRVRPAIDPAECEVSECGPDGVPLSLYAG